MKRILVIDDDQHTTRLLELVLSKAGYEVVSVNNTEVILTTAVAYMPDLILLDYMMVGINGLEVCKNLRATPEFSQTPIIMFTAIGDINTKIAAYESGANDFITKPIHPEELRLKIQAAIGLNR